MKTLPKNICAHPDGLLVRVKRGDVLFQAFTTDLGRAIELRDKFLALAGGVARPAIVRIGKQAVRSNTGVAGVSETTMWRRDRAYPCFSVDWSVNGVHKMKRVFYGRNGVSRSTALQSAIALRIAVCPEIREDLKALGGSHA